MLDGEWKGKCRPETKTEQKLISSANIIHINQWKLCILTADQGAGEGWAITWRKVHIFPLELINFDIDLCVNIDSEKVPASAFKSL